MLRFELDNQTTVVDPGILSQIFDGVDTIMVELGHEDCSLSVIDGTAKRTVKQNIEGGAVEFLEFGVRGLLLVHDQAGVKLPKVTVLIPLEMAQKVGEALAAGKVQVVQSLEQAGIGRSSVILP